MKEIIKKAIICGACTLLLMAGCSAPANKEDEADRLGPKSVAAGGTPEPFEEEIETDAGDFSIEPSDAQIDEAYQKADEAYRWFTMSSMPLSQDTIDHEGLLYQRVDFPGITNFDELLDYMLTIFAPNIAAGMVSAAEMTGQYLEFDGVLYAMAFDGVPGLDFGEVSTEIIRNDDGMITYRVTVEILGGDDFDTVVDHKVVDMTYYNPDGEWVFIWFEDIYYNG